MRLPTVMFLALVVGLLVAGQVEAAPNPQVAGLQVALRAHGLYPGPIDGIAGPGTKGAVRAFQGRAGLPVDGVASLRTRVALGKLGRPLFGKRMLRPGLVGWDVSVLQFLLVRQHLFPPAKITGRFGATTWRALAAFQRRLHLTPDGIAGPLTFAALGSRDHVPIAAGAGLAGPRYVVRPGDTLTSIAVRYQTTVGAIARANGLDPRRYLLAGTALHVPALAASAAAATTLTPWSVQAALDFWAGRFGIDLRLARALAWMESGYNPNLTSAVGAWGVMQVLPVTWDFVETVLLHERVPRTAEGNVRVGLAYLRHLLREFGGDERLALAAWYQGARAVRERGVFSVTQAFVEDVLALKSRM